MLLLNHQAGRAEVPGIYARQNLFVLQNSRCYAGRLALAFSQGCRARSLARECDCGERERESLNVGARAQWKRDFPGRKRLSLSREPS